MGFENEFKKQTYFYYNLLKDEENRCLKTYLKCLPFQRGWQNRHLPLQGCLLRRGAAMEERWIKATRHPAYYSQDQTKPFLKGNRGGKELFWLPYFLFLMVCRTLVESPSPYIPGYRIRLPRRELVQQSKSLLGGFKVKVIGYSLDHLPESLAKPAYCSWDERDTGRSSPGICFTSLSKCLSDPW